MKCYVKFDWLHATKITQLKDDVVSVRFSSLIKMAMDWMLDQTVDKEVKLMSKKFKGGNKKEGKGK